MIESSIHDMNVCLMHDVKCSMNFQMNVLK